MLSIYLLCRKQGAVTKSLYFKNEPQHETFIIVLGKCFLSRPNLLILRHHYSETSPAYFVIASSINITSYMYVNYMI